MTISEKEQRVMFLLKRAIRLNPNDTSVKEALEVLTLSQNAAIATEARMLSCKVP